MSAEISHFLSQTIEYNEIPGVVAMAANGHDIIYAGAFGERGLHQAEPMTHDTLFWIASMTKAVTATAAMQLVEQGRLPLETPAGSIVPTLADVQVLTGFDNEGQPQLRPPNRAITVRHLLTHTAGFSYDMWNGEIARYRKVAGVPGTQSCTSAALALPLLFDPGDRWDYGISIDWLGRVIEEVTGQRLGAYMQQTIFGPLGMTETSFAPTAEQRTRLATMHMREANGTLSPLEFSPPIAPELHMGGSGLYSTGPDYLRFLQLFLNDGMAGEHRVLAPATVALMAQNQIGDLCCRPLRSVKPRATNDVDFFPGMVQKWGLSFLINTEPSPQGRSAGSLAWAGLGNTYFWIDRQQGIAGLFLTQIFPFFDAGVVESFREFERAIYREG